MVELLRQYRAKETRDAELHINQEVLERIKTAITNGRNIADIVDELNRDQVPPLQGHGPWDYVMVHGALELAAQQASATSPPFPEQGGCLILKEGGKDLRFEITDAVYGIVYREEEYDTIEFCGDSVSVSAIVPRGSLTEAAADRNFAPLAGTELQLRDYSSSFDPPFLAFPEGGRKKICGGKISIETAESLTPPFGGGGKRPASGRLTASVEIAVKGHENMVAYSGRLELAFSF